MNYFESLYANLYYARVKAGESVSGRPVTGNIVLACCLTLFIIAVFLTVSVLIPPVGDMFEDGLRELFGRAAGKTIGRLLAIFGILLIYPIIRYTVGNQANYDRIISQFLAMPEETQKQISSKGARFMYVCFLSIAVPMIIFGIKALF